MSDKEETSRSIKLNKLKDGEYCVWIIQAEATFKVHKCLGIVEGTDLKPVVPDDDGNNEARRARRRRMLNSWQKHHDLALEALLKALEPNDLRKVSSIKGDAVAIWARLKDEYAKSLDFEYIRINAEFQSLRKESKTPMNDHINKFNTLLQSVEYNRPPEIPELQTASINLSFLHSLGTDWEVWGMAKGNAIRTTPTAELMVEVRALGMRGSSSHGQNDTPAAEMKANTAKFGNGNRGNNGGNSGGKWKKNRGDRSLECKATSALVMYFIT
jgi:gag-polypeptide of LTR copia-type